MRVRLMAKRFIFSAVVALSLTTAHVSQAACLASNTRLCLLNGRFSASLKWNDGSGQKDAFVAGPKTDGASSAAGLFYFYSSDSNNWEILAKMIDGCGTNNHFWVLVAASTGFGWELSVKDETSGVTKTFSHPLNGQASGIADFEAFSTCGSTPPPTPTPAPSNCSSNGPITDLQKDCSKLGYLYSSPSGLVGAAVTANGTVAAVCVSDGLDTLCSGGPVQSATQAKLVQINLNGGAYTALGAGSFLRLRNNGNNLDIRWIVSGDTTDLFGFTWDSTRPLNPSSAKYEASESPDSEQGRRILEALNAYLNGTQAADRD